MSGKLFNMLYSDYHSTELLVLLVTMFARLGTPEYVRLTWSSMAALLAKQSIVSRILTSLMLGWAPQPANSWASLCLRRRTIPCCVCSEKKISIHVLKSVAVESCTQAAAVEVCSHAPSTNAEIALGHCFFIRSPLHQLCRYSMSARWKALWSWQPSSHARAAWRPTF